MDTKEAVVVAEVEALKAMDTHELRVAWRKLHRSSPHPHLPRYLLQRILAYRIQARAFGDLDRELIRYFDKVGQDLQKKRLNGKAVPLQLPPLRAKSLRPGTVLVREHDGAHHHVTVTADGFLWNGENYRSLSEVARAITGTSWNGPRFFGLRSTMAVTS